MAQPIGGSFVLRGYGRRSQALKGKLGRSGAPRAPVPAAARLPPRRPAAVATRGPGGSPATQGLTSGCCSIYRDRIQSCAATQQAQQAGQLCMGSSGAAPPPAVPQESGGSPLRGANVAHQARHTKPRRAPVHKFQRLPPVRCCSKAVPRLLLLLPPPPPSLGRKRVSHAARYLPRLLAAPLLHHLLHLALSLAGQLPKAQPHAGRMLHELRAARLHALQGRQGRAQRGRGGCRGRGRGVLSVWAECFKFGSPRPSRFPPKPLPASAPLLPLLNPGVQRNTT